MRVSKDEMRLKKLQTDISMADRTATDLECKQLKYTAELVGSIRDNAKLLKAYSHSMHAATIDNDEATIEDTWVRTSAVCRDLMSDITLAHQRMNPGARSYSTERGACLAE